MTGAHNHTGITTTSGLHTHTNNAIGGQGNNGLVTADGTQTATATDNSINELKLWTVPIALSIDNAGNHNHGISTDGSHHHDVTVNNTGNNLPHNNMQPTLFAGNVFILSKSFFLTAYPTSANI